MTRAVQLLPLIAAILFTAPFAFASDRYDHDRGDRRSHHDYEYRSYDNSINHSFNYTYGYPYADHWYTYPSYNYGSYATYGYESYGYSNDYHRKPTCSISTMRTSGANPYDGRVTISWWSSNATSAYLSGVGNVNTSGSQTVYGSYTTYTLTVYGPGGSTSCSASSPYYDSGSKHGKYSHHSYGYVASPSFTYAVQSYPYVSGTIYPTVAQSYVLLSQTPYTGFDFGPIGNSLYWLGMILVAALGAYAILYSRFGIMPRSLAHEVAAAARNQARFVKSLVR